MQKSAELGQNQPENPKLIDGGIKFLLQGPSRGGSQKNLKGGSLRLVVVGHYPVVRVFRPEEHTNRYRRNEDESRPS
jgi:hypothetical protein